MPLFHSRSGLNQTEQRSSTRVKISIPAKLRLTIGDREGRLVDMSETGARLEMANPPPEGAPAIMLWGEHEAFCKVVWAANGTCGVQFDRRVSAGVVLEAIGQDMDLPATAIANRNNIPMGRKRSKE